VASTLLAVDDSVTMRKVLEITFASPDFRIVTANSPDAALQKLKADKPDLVIADGTLEPKNGYDLCKEIKRLSPSTPVLYLSSKQNPFDAGKGAGAQVDDHMDKPFDTQQMIDKVKKLLGGGKADPVPAAATAAPVRPAANPLAATMIGTAAPAPNRTMPSAAAAVAQAGAAPAARSQQRAQTLVYNPGVAMPPIGGASPQPRPLAPTGRSESRTPATTPIAGVPAARHATTLGGTAATSPSLVAAAHAAQANAPAADPAHAHINGQMAAKLEELGLTPQQVDAVVALSREVVERVVWEVVPVLAETMIKEEIARLTR